MTIVAEQVLKVLDEYGTDWGNVVRTEAETLPYIKPSSVTGVNPLTIASAQNISSTIAVGAKRTYWAITHIGTVTKAPLGCGIAARLISVISQPLDIALDETSIYRTKVAGPHKVRKMTPK